MSASSRRRLQTVLIFHPFFHGTIWRSFEDLTSYRPSPRLRLRFMKVLVCDPVSSKGIALLQQRPDFQVNVLPKKLSESELLPVVADVVAIVVRSETKITRKVIEAAPNL